VWDKFPQIRVFGEIRPKTKQLTCPKFSLHGRADQSTFRAVIRSAQNGLGGIESSISQVRFSMTLGLIAVVAAAIVWLLSKTRILSAAAAAPALTLAAGGVLCVGARLVGAQGLPIEFISGAAQAGLGALVFASAAQLRISQFAKVCPASFRLTFGGAPLFLLLCTLSAFVLLPQVSPVSALLIGSALMLNGAAFDRRAVTGAPAPLAIKSAVRMESAAIIALGAPIAILSAAFAVAPTVGEAPLAPLLAASIDVVQGFAFGGFVGYVAAKYLARRPRFHGLNAAVAAGLGAYVFAALLGAEPVVAAGAAGLIWGEETRGAKALRIKLRRIVERTVSPAAYFAFGATFAVRAFGADMLTIIFALAAVTALRAGPRFAMLQRSDLPKESQAFLAWFGGAPGAASALFVLSILDRSMIVDHEAVMTVCAIAVAAGVVAARLTSRPLAQAFLRQSALAKRRRMFAS
jgi:NhaP-type Na+/H+ or K+/H+ antiporter